MTFFLDVAVTRAARATVAAVLNDQARACASLGSPLYALLLERAADDVDALAEHRDTLHDLIERPVQTNEVGRCAALLGGFLESCAGTTAPGGLWGPADSPAHIVGPLSAARISP